MSDLFTNANENGYHCPHCGRLIKTWKKPLIGIAVAELIKLYNIYRVERVPVHISRFSEQRSNFYTLSHWGLIQGSEKVEGKRTAGLWQPTQVGIDFIMNRITIKSHAVTQDNVLIKLTGEEKNVVQALGKKFNYDELINASQNYELH